MTDPTRYYDLMLLLDPEAPEQGRSQVIDQVRSQISSGSGNLEGDADWGMRRLAYEIDHRSEAQYHLFQLRAENELLEQLDRSLSIDDAVLRHRIIRLPGAPPAQTPRPTPPSSSYERSETPQPAAEAAESETPAPAAEGATEAAAAEPAAPAETAAAAVEPAPAAPAEEASAAPAQEAPAAPETAATEEAPAPAGDEPAA